MKCPLFTGELVVEAGEIRSGGFDCLKEECAWWNEQYGICAILLLANSTYVVQSFLADILEKMPVARE